MHIRIESGPKVEFATKNLAGASDRFKALIEFRNKLKNPLNLMARVDVAIAI